MLGVIITGHGAFASGLLQALEQVAGRQTLCMAVDFPEGHSTEALGLRLAAACAHCDDGDGVVFLSDMLGGSPFREAANIALAHPGYEVIAGTNLQMAVEMMLDRPQLDTEAFRDQALECGQRGITSLWHQQHHSAPALPTESGI